MIAYEADKIFIFGTVISTDGESVTLSVDPADARDIRKELEWTFEGMDDKYIPGWMKKGCIFHFKSRYPVFVYEQPDDLIKAYKRPAVVGSFKKPQYNSMKDMYEDNEGAILRGSKIWCCIAPRKGVGVFLKAVSFEVLVTTTLSNFFERK